MTDDFAREVIDRLARIETKQKAGDEASEHRHRNLRTIIDGLATKKDVEDVEERVESLEEDRKWIVRGVVGAWVAGTGVVAFFSRKIGI